MLVTLTYCLVYLLVGPALILVNKKIMKVCVQLHAIKLALEHAQLARATVHTLQSQCGRGVWVGARRA